MVDEQAREAAERKDFFISYTAVDSSWAEWIAWQLEADNYRTILQEWDFHAGDNFIRDMDQATRQTERTIAVLSPDYFESRFGSPEWQEALRRDPTGEKGTLLPVRVRECEVTGLLASIAYIDLVGLDEAAAREKLLNNVRRERAKPSVAPAFPATSSPAFPSALSSAQEATFKRTDERYREALSRVPRLTQIQILHMGAPLMLADVYIRLRLSTSEGRAETGERAYEARRLNDPATESRRQQKQLEERFARAFEPMQVLQQFQRCVFLGEPGAGKTTLLKYLTHQLLQQSSPDLTLVPVYLPLSEFAHSGETDLLSFAALWLAREFGLDASELRTYLDILLNKKQTLFLLDALDEAATGMTTQESDEQYTRTLAAIERLANRCEHIVVTARLAGYHQRRPLPYFTELEVLDFRWPEIEQFLDRWFQLRTPTGRQNRVEALKARLRETPSMLALATNPLLLTQIALVFERKDDVPEQRATLYASCVELFQREWDAASGTSHAHLLRGREEASVLCELAWQMHRQRRRDLSEGEALDILTRLLPAFPHPDLSPQSVLRELSGEQGLLRWQGNRRYAFVHLTFQEYFTAQYLKERGDETALLAFLGDPWWEEVILLYAGGVHDASSLLTHLLTTEQRPGEPPEDIFWSKLILAGRCLVEQPTVHAPHVREAVIERLFENLPAAEFQFNRRRLAETLAEIGRATGGTRTEISPLNRRLLASLREAGTAPELRTCLSQAIGGYGARSLIHPLLDLLVQLPASFHAEDCAKLSEAIERLAQPDDVLYRRLLGIARDAHAERWLATEAAYLLAVTGTEQAARTLLADLADTNFDEAVCTGLAYSCAMLGDADTIEDLLVFVSAPEQSACLALVLEALVERHLNEIVPTLLSLLPREELSAYVRSSIAIALLRLGDHSTADKLRALVASTSLNSEVRLACTRVFAALSDSHQQEEILSLLRRSDEDTQVRCFLALGLAETANDSLRAPLYLLYRAEQVEEVRQALVIALGVLGEPSVIPELQALWETNQIPVSSLKRAVVDALARQLDPSLCETLLRSSKIAAFRRADFAHALGRTSRSEELLPLLIALTRNFVVQQDVRAACAEAVGELGETYAAAEQVHDLLRAYKYHRTYSYHSAPPVEALYHALWRISRRAGLLVLSSLTPEADPYAYRLIERGEA